MVLHFCYSQFKSQSLLFNQVYSHFFDTKRDDRFIGYETITALLAALVTANVIAVATAFTHLLFNILGIIIIWPMRGVPLFLAESLAELAVKNKFVPLLYIVTVFFVIPSTLIYLLG